MKGAFVMQFYSSPNYSYGSSECISTRTVHRVRERQHDGCLRLHLSLTTFWLGLSVLLTLIPNLVVQAAKHHRHPISLSSPAPPTNPPSPKPHPLLHNFTCSNLAQMLQRKSNLLLSLGLRIDDIMRQQAITAEEKLKMEILKIYQSELKATETSLLMVLRDLNQTLGSDYRSLAEVKRSCQMRLDDMRNAAVMVEEDFNTILELEKEMHSLHPHSNLTHNAIIAEIMSEVAHAADSLESDLTGAHVFQHSRNQEGAALETVVKLQEGGLAERHNLAYGYQKMLVNSREERGRVETGAMAVLVDSASNQYVLARPRDVTVPIEDHRLIHDIINLLLLSFVLGGLCSLIKVPSLLGYILAGLLLGPVGYDVISSVVQVRHNVDWECTCTLYFDSALYTCTCTCIILYKNFTGLN